MGFFESWKKNREEKARERRELQLVLAAKREEEKRVTRIMLDVNVQITNAALRETIKERSRDLSSVYQDQMFESISAKARTLFIATTDMIDGGQLIRQFLASHRGGTGEPGDYAIFCVYVASVINKCAELLEASVGHKDYSIKSGDGFISVPHKEIVTGMDTTLAASLTRAEWILSDRPDNVGDYLRRLVISAVNHKGLRLAGPIATKALANVKTLASNESPSIET